MKFFKTKAPKVFCIGCNKTGTTSLEAALKILGYKLGNQGKGELLIEDWARRDFRKIIRFCKTAAAFQDIPFSLDFTYQALDYAYPGSKFILTVRDNPEEWYQSVVRFYTKMVGKNRLPTLKDLQEFGYRGIGWMHQAHRAIFGDDPASLFDKDLYTNSYLRHNMNVRNYFRHRPADLLVLNVADPSAMDLLCVFLGFQNKGWSMPHLNSSVAENPKAR